MSISLSTAFYNVNNLYNKPEMSQYYFVSVLLPIIIFAIFGFAGYSVFQQSSAGNISDSQIFAMVLSFIGAYLVIFVIGILMSIVINGIYTKALHNSITGKSEIFPSLQADFSEIFKTGAKYLGCTIIGSIACSIINQTSSILLGPLSAAAKDGDPSTAAVTLTITGVLFSAIYLFQMVFLWLMMISFSRKLKFEHYFDFSWCWKLLTKRVKDLTMLGVYNILMFVPIVLAVVCLVIYAAPIIKTAPTAAPDQVISALLPAFLVVFLGTYIYYLYIQIINIDLITQIIGKKREVDNFNRL